MLDILAYASQAFFWEGYAPEYGRMAWTEPDGGLDFWGCYIMGGEL